ncbi:acetylornithine transaminase [Euzebya sp.]|uniref:acetylornithine transaminase n=1 Tax=Euzebya sp. TaxID=1971409 RepID=UPI0035152C97
MIEDQLTEDDVLLPTYGPRPVTFTSGAGSWLTATDGGRYLDFLCGLAVTGLGHAHPVVTQAVADQAARLTHTSNLFGTRPVLELADRLRRTLGWDDGRAFFCNSGAEANEAALKLARRHGKHADPQKVHVVALDKGFHGRLMGALKLTGNPAKHAPFEPLGTWATHVPADDPDAIAAAVDDRTCAVWLEVVQGEGGVRPLSEEVLAAARAACDDHDALLVVDEVQTGVGRLGEWYGWQTTTVEPDVVCLAKGLANGLPIGAIVARGVAAKAFQLGDHATTFGGGPVVCAAANAVLDTIESDGLLAHTRAMGSRLAAGLEALAADSPLVTGQRGRGLLRAMTLSGDFAPAVADAALRHHLVVNAVAPDAVRLAPPLNVTPDEVDEALSRLRAAVADVASPTGASPTGASPTGAAPAETDGR